MPCLVDRFIERWQSSGAAERANYALFLSELADLLGVARPDPATADVAQNTYTIDRAVALPGKAGATTMGYAGLATRFSRAKPDQMAPLLATLEVLGLVRQIDDGAFTTF